MTKKYYLVSSILLFFSLLSTVHSSAGNRYANYEECLLHTLEIAADSLLVSDLKKSCSSYLEQKKTVMEQQREPLEQTETTPSQMAVVSRRISYESQSQRNLFSIIPHKPNYILLASYNDHPNGESLALDDDEVDSTEIKFQVSFKVPLMRDILGEGNGHLYAAYTMQSFWQAYNSDISSPFRETNHEPEIFLALHSGWKVFGWNNPSILAGFSHQSNGRSGSNSRSWNRLYLDCIMEKGDFALSIKPWYRLPESTTNYLGGANADDNPDISEYLGYGEITGAWSQNGHTVSVMLRNSLRRHHNRGAVQLGWSFPFSKEMPLKGYLQYFNGYGESLIDYNASVSRIGFGFLLTDWL